MKIDPFLNCLAATGIDTGTAILGAYSFTSGNTGVVFNQLLPSGSNFFSGIPYRAAYPLIFNGTGNNTSGVFSKNQFYQIADVYTDSFTAIINMNYSGCLNSGNTNYLLASTNPSPTSTTSGVYLGITPSNRLFVNAKNFSYTIPQEIGIGDFVYFGITSNRFLNFGLFSLINNKYHGKIYDAGSGTLEVKDLCFGGALNYPTNFTGYSGKLNEIYLFSGSLKTGFITPCINCSYATGYSTSLSPQSYTQTKIVGSSWSGVSTSGITSYQKALVSFPKVGGGTGFAYADSGVSGSISLYQALIPTTVQITGADYFPITAFFYDNSPRLSGTTADIQFDMGLVSGDVVEIYTYPVFNSGIGLKLDNYKWPNYSGEVMLYSNGLAETSGVDFLVAFNGLVSGFDVKDTLLYDVVTGTNTMNYISGLIQTGAFDSRFARITGASGVDFSYPFKWDIYFDGQKMASGVDYTIVSTGVGMAGVISDMSGAFNFTFYDINYSGGNYREIKFAPLSTSTIKMLYSISGNQSMISGISGFSEQVWVNGIRQNKGTDFTYVPRCRFCSGQYSEQNYQFNLYDSSSSSWQWSSYP